MRKLTKAALSVSLAIPAAAQANLLLYEPFNYPITTDSTDTLIGQTNSFASQTWDLTGSADNSVGPSMAQGDPTDNLNSLSIPGLMPSVGNALLPRYNDTKDTAAPRIGFINGTTIPKTTSPAGTTVFYSLMLRVDSNSTDVQNTGSINVGGTSTATNQGIYIAGFNNNTGSQSGALTGVMSALTMHQDPVGSDNFSLGLTDNVNGTANNSQLRTFDDAQPLAKGSTIFVVASYTFGSGGVTTDSANLWVNPDIGTFGQAAPVTAPNFTVTTNTTGASPETIASFFVRDNSSDPSDMTLDEARVGTTWADVTPRNPSLITGDANLDGVLNSEDLDALDNGLANHLTGWANGDFNGDGVINADDFTLFQYSLALYGNNTPVPEPGALAILALLAMPIITLRKRCRLSRI